MTLPARPQTRNVFGARERSRNLGSSLVFLAGLAALAGCGATSPVGNGTSGQPSPGAASDPTAQLRGQTGTGGTSRVAEATAVEGPTGTWYLDVGKRRETLAITCFHGGCEGALSVDDGSNAWSVELAAWDAAAGLLSFRAGSNGEWRFFRLRLMQGVLTGRFATYDLAEPPMLDAQRFTGHVTGWQSETFDAALTPRVFDLYLEGGEHATLRLDADPDGGAGAFLARIKVYATDASGAFAEEDEYDATVERWDGTALDVTVPDPAWERAFHGEVSGRTLGGTFAVGPEFAFSAPFSGTRAEVLSHGLSARSAAEREMWQRRTRARLELLMMDGNPQPLSQTVDVVRTSVSPLLSERAPPDRDDGMAFEHPQSYHLSELTFEVTLPDRWRGLEPLTRRAHGWYAVPDGPAPPGGFPAVMAINGHTGSARMTFDPDSEYFWYGDAWARRGYAVLAVDIGHRPFNDRQGVYTGYDWGDDTDGGNGLHPAIESNNMDSDWEEDGERVFDVRRGLDWLLARPEVDGSRVAITGISMGGEVTTFAAALEPRFTLAVAAGFSPDLSTLIYRGSHGCWQWAHGSIREFLDPSDLHALIAPRPLLVETGRADVVYSVKPTPFSGDLQQLRRSRVAWADRPERLVHYLHYDVHHYHAGDSGPGGGPGTGVLAASGPDAGFTADTSWQQAPDILPLGIDLFEWVSSMIGP